MELVMKRLVFSACLTLVTIQAYSTPIYHPPGPDLTYGPVSNGQTIMSDINNPAAGAATLNKTGGEFRFGVFSSLGFGFEYGDVDNLYDNLDAAANDLSNSFTGSSVAVVQASIDNVNNALAAVEQGGYGKAFVSGHIPLMPLVISSNVLGGSLVFDANVSAVVRVGAIQDPVAFDTTTAQTIISGGTSGYAGDVFVDATGGAGSETFDLNNTSSLLLNAAFIKEAAFGYSTQVFYSNTMGKLFAGVRGKLYQVTLYRDFELMENITDSQQIFDDLDSGNGKVSNAFGVDAGLLWVSNHYRIGATINNINQPSYDYNNIDPVKLATVTGNPVADARVVQTLTDTLTYTMEKQVTMEAAIFSANQNWVINASLDTNAIKGPTGDDYQWATVSMAYATESWMIPGLRAGYRVNKSGSEVKYFTGGITVFKIVNLDVAYGLDKVTVNGDRLPRSLIMNLGMEMTF